MYMYVYTVNMHTYIYNMQNTNKHKQTNKQTNKRTHTNTNTNTKANKQADNQPISQTNKKTKYQTQHKPKQTKNTQTNKQSITHTYTSAHAPTCCLEALRAAFIISETKRTLQNRGVMLLVVAVMVAMVPGWWWCLVGVVLLVVVWPVLEVVLPLPPPLAFPIVCCPARTDTNIACFLLKGRKYLEHKSF